MAIASTLQHKIISKEARIAVIGLGYVGLPVACMFAKAGFRVTGIDLDEKRIAKINSGINPIEGIEPGLSDLVATVAEGGDLRCTSDYSELANCDVVLLSVQTPIDATHQPTYTHLKAALTSLGDVLTEGTMVIIESTLSPGTMTGVVQTVLEAKSGLRAGEDFLLGHCPERVMPGRLLNNIEKMNRVIGGIDVATSETMVQLYQQIVKGDLDTTDMLTAELVKTTENAYRDVQIAFANEVAKICESVGADVWSLRDLVNKSPGRNMLYPGAGVGGHCIPKDPWLLVASATESNPTLIPTARAVNSAMPRHVLDLTQQALGDRLLSEAVIVVLGYAYLENSDDSRNSPSADYIQLAIDAGATVKTHDPFIEPYNGDLQAMVQGADALAILVAHDDYRGLDWAQLTTEMRSPTLVDARNVIEQATLPETINLIKVGVHYTSYTST